ncbi:uncharacterized protein PHACADRAFT_256887 [Phanerochaete carnosa HHB-10118-sp]|uniref:Cytochrome P450 n=1 Tax=Phanerochaete carnosa (strain HHB-10118-sp) TaxID=650164 RepID=K5WZK9_PHACS|nr:uncharacterized protein PHACADRAFT_256887 [Phanerochaete carnosa HHB-10118-sp]EKM55937.1 hypothetical protein PHACADRAFT_256887 [Phanerochaete carnosa HHB-10118-sp]
MADFLVNALKIAQTPGLVLICVLLVIRVASRIVQSTKKAVPLPPGPDVSWFEPGPKVPLKYTEMAKTYGPVFSYKRGNQVVCIINSYKDVIEIMQKHGADLTGRPQHIAAGDIVSGGMRTLLTDAGERLRKLRRALHSQLQPMAAVQHRPIQFKSALDLILDILQDPKDHMNHAKRFAASLILTMTYGKTTPTKYSDPEVVERSVHTRRLRALIPAGRHVVDRYPLLRHVPFVTATLRKWHEEELALFLKMVEGVKAQVSEHKARPSFTTYLLEHQEQYGLSDNELAYLAGSMFGAGAESTATAISFVLMAAATHPKIQAEVQAQLNGVVGKDRVPTFNDEKLLPLVTAFYLETFRWRPISWGGAAHRATSDVIWNQYVIPAGATVFGNHWAIGHDPAVFPDPDEFRPSRWLDATGNLRDDIKPVAYGFGRRVCVGQNVANKSLFINTALLLWAFDIREDSAAPIDTMGFTDSSTVRVLPFQVKFSPRIEHLEEIVEASRS